MDDGLSKKWSSKLDKIAKKKWRNACIVQLQIYLISLYREWQEDEAKKMLCRMWSERIGKEESRR